jgi:hypothetical protein
VDFDPRLVCYDGQLMLIYLDMCCLKRQFDDQSQLRIRLETEAVLGLLAMEPDRLSFVRSTALFLENSVNPVPERAARVHRWLLAALMVQVKDSDKLNLRATELARVGFKNFDALHIATAEDAGADIFATTDDRILSAARRNQTQIRTRILSVLECAKDLVT